ncbi:MAG: tripartite tricarboxylate transporter substrate-binding protein [Pseudomonadota bacterium]
METIKAATAPDVREKLTAIGFDVVTGTPHAFAQLIQAELAKWRQVAKQMGLKAE